MPVTKTFTTSFQLIYFAQCVVIMYSYTRASAGEVEKFMDGLLKELGEFMRMLSLEFHEPDSRLS